MRYGECNSCGSCCKAIALSLNIEEHEPEMVHDGDVLCYFWQPITRTEAIAINPNYEVKKLKDYGILGMKERINLKTYYYRCLLYHPNFGCALHLLFGEKAKPKACSDFPWYGGSANPFNSTMSPFCGFNIDLYIAEQCYSRMTIESWDLNNAG
jgi:Fe-S-cluster containining protein